MTIRTRIATASDLEPAAALFNAYRQFYEQAPDLQTARDFLAAERHAAQTGRVKMELTTARTNKTAQAAYESLGWQRDDIFLGYGKRVEA